MQSVKLRLSAPRNPTMHCTIPPKKCQ
uniref:Uncharacterized protein n=1 Tax=Anguilla anguilla TaxID=7936 RepID=A0A0E9QLR1_ANGAN